ncbi:MAG TPA: hypothetical protein PLC79_06760 [Phycisphaerae bacterium]|nr:hypothetical protein [Phycisphaerae bacterium]
MSLRVRVCPWVIQQTTAVLSVLWVGGLGLFLLWLRRYYVAIRAVRWANV